MPFSYRSYKKKASSMSACIIARHRVIGRPGVGGGGSQAGRRSVGGAGRVRQAGRPADPPPGRGIFIFSDR